MGPKRRAGYGRGDGAAAAAAEPQPACPAHAADPEAEGVLADPLQVLQAECSGLGERLRRHFLYLQHNDAGRFRSLYKTAAHHVRSLAGLAAHSGAGPDGGSCSAQVEEGEAGQGRRDLAARRLLPALACDTTGPGGSLVVASFDALRSAAERRLLQLAEAAERIYADLCLADSVGARVAEVSQHLRQDAVHPVRNWYCGRSEKVDERKAARDFECAAPPGSPRRQAFALRPQVCPGGPDSPDALKGHYVYLSLLLAQAAALNGPFQERVAALCAEVCQRRGEGSCAHQPAPVKRPQRICAKLKNEYKGTAEPREAQLLDVVRCLVLCDTADTLVDAAGAVCAAFPVARVKNGFRSDAVGGTGWRAVVCNVVLGSPGCRQIAEVQLSLAAIAKERSRMHTLYNIVRAEHPRDVR
eukprot:TRINITY_DN18609_c0_g1_i1.p1 TRINITY_DN18609_c0_g1~~TRINITY_DN18609_c0_g1_i1.p1  ORF type:complete len:414 (+),score=126.15 TRINITY_DN18609_c0_g1_i1:79-1320(+)